MLSGYQGLGSVLCRTQAVQSQAYTLMVVIMDVFINVSL